MGNSNKANEKAQLSSLKNNKEFNDIFKKITTDDRNINEKEKEFILLCAILFFKFYDKDNRYKSYFKIGYYIILKYSLLFKDFKPLYDISIEIGFYPTCKTIIDNQFISLDRVSNIISQKVIESQFTNEREGYIETYEQNSSAKKILESKVNSLAYIAPTSFGKSSLIKDIIIKNNYFKIGIIVPTKSLLIQTYNDIKKLKLDYKLILHDEMYDNNSKFIGILTQERATRLMSKNDLHFDILFIDEAHSLLKNKPRSIILSRLIKLNQLKNDNLKLVYLSPLIDNTNCLKFNKNDQIDTSVIRHNLKCEDIYLLENNESFVYNRFTDEYYNQNIEIDYFNYITKYSKFKNFIFHHRPIMIESLAANLSTKLKNITSNNKIQLIISTLKNEVHENFYVINYIPKGIIYIHAKLPNLIKEYLESKFKEIDEIKYIIANSVILEGINLPIDTLFITSTSYLQGKDLTNLIGRVNRLNYVFQEKNLNKLNPKIFFLNNALYQGEDSVRNKISLLRDSSFRDKIENPLLCDYDIDHLGLNTDSKEKRKIKDESIVKNTNFLIEDNKNLKFSEQVKKYFIENNIDDFYKDISKVVETISIRIEKQRKNETWNNFKLIDKIFSLFVEDLSDSISDYELERLKNKAARNYYQYYLENTQKQPLKQNIIYTYKYFETKAKSNDPYLFIGKSYGEIVRNSSYNNYEYISKVYINLRELSKDRLINIAIVKLKIEEDFVSFKLNKLIVFLHDFNLIPDDEYFYFIYGTNNKELIKFARLGLSLNIISKLITDNQIENLSLDKNGNLQSNGRFDSYMLSQPELFKFEINKYLQ